MAVTPYYNKPARKAYTGISAVLLRLHPAGNAYNVPGRTGVNMLPATVKRLAAIDNIVALGSRREYGPDVGTD